MCFGLNEELRLRTNAVFSRSLDGSREGGFREGDFREGGPGV